MYLDVSVCLCVCAFVCVCVCARTHVCVCPSLALSRDLPLSVTLSLLAPLPVSLSHTRALGRRGISVYLLTRHLWPSDSRVIPKKSEKGDGRIATAPTRCTRLPLGGFPPGRGNGGRDARHRFRLALPTNSQAMCHTCDT